MKPGKTFNLSKRTKTMMASIVNTEERNAFKRAMIQAQLASEVVPRGNKDRGNSNKDRSNDNTTG
jgi:hypothetical protein